MKIELNDDKYAIIDDDDWDLVSKYKWSAVYKCGSWYAFSFVNNKVCSMHKLILLNTNSKIFQDNEVIDHINHNSLDNRRENLRLCSRTENGMNRSKNKNNSSGFKGVMVRNPPDREKKFHVIHRHKASGKEYRKYFYTIEAAALFYDDLVSKLYDIPFLNFPNIDESRRVSILKNEKESEIIWHKSRGIEEWSSYVGVNRHSDRRHWRARVRHNNRIVFDKLFVNEEEAARARDRAIVELGLNGMKSVRLNFPNDIDKGE